MDEVKNKDLFTRTASIAKFKRAHGGIKMNLEVKIYKTNDDHFQTKFYDPKTGKRKRKRFQTLKEAKTHKLEIENRINNKGLSAF